MTILLINFHSNYYQWCEISSLSGRATLPDKGLGRGGTLVYSMRVLLPGTAPPTHQTATVCNCSPICYMVSHMVDNTLNVGSFAHDWEWFDGCQSIYHSPVGSARHISRALLALRFSANSVKGTIYRALRGSMTEVLQEGSVLTSSDGLITKCHPFHLVVRFH